MTVTKARVLLVEDEDLVSMLTEDMLSDLGYDVVASAANLESGIQIATDTSFEVAVLDINLHGKQSYPIAEILRNRQIPFVFVSGYIGKESRRSLRRFRHFRSRFHQKRSASC